MSQSATKHEPAPIQKPDVSFVDFAREEAAFEKERERLVRDHPGWNVLVHQDEVVGAFRTADEAHLAGFHRFGDVKMMIREITAFDEPVYCPLADLNHPCVQRIT